MQQISILKKTLHSYEHYSSIHKSQDMKTNLMTCDKRIGKEQKYLTISNSMEEPDHYAKSAKPDTQRQMLHDLTYMRHLKWLNSCAPGTTRQWFLRIGAEQWGYNGKMLLQVYNVSIMADEFQHSKVTMASIVLCHILEIC